MAYAKPKTGETRKQYLHRAYGIGKGGGKGRISAEGHEKVAEAVARGWVFPDTVAVVAKPAPKRAPAAPKPAPVPVEAKGIDPSTIRAWAKDKGIHVGPRGRISADITRQFLDDVPPEQRTARGPSNGEKDLRQAAPRVHPKGTTWRAEFISGAGNNKGEKETVILSEKTACGNCRVSLGWCACDRPRVTVGYERGPVRVTIVRPNGD